jgi:VWFA-related protein
MARFWIAALVVGLAACLALGASAHAVVAGPQPGPAPPPASAPAPTPQFRDEIAVRLITVIARVVDGAGNPVLGLTPADFRIRVGRREVPVVAVDWVGPAEGAAAPPAAGDSTGAPPPAPPAGPPGKLVVLFVQADNNSPTRSRGHLRTLPFTRELLAALQREDSVAVVSFDSHLKLWQDFTRDHERIPDVIYQAIHFGGTPPTPAGHARDARPARPASPADDAGGAAGPSLAPTFDVDAARRAATAERGLEVTAEALAALPGEKVMVFLGWGLGEFSLGARTRAFDAAAQALAEARVTVFALDVTEADFHNLELGLQNVAAATGGTYDKTFRFPGLAVRQLARTLSGYYALSLEAAALPESGGSVEVELRDPRGHRWTVLTRPISFPAEIGEQ